MEDLVAMRASPSLFQGLYSGKRVLLTGHTGFKGAWLARWLLELGAEVHGYALQPPTDPALFDLLGLARRMKHQIADIRDAAAVKDAIREARPDFVFHLAAQAILRESYAQPLDTFAINVMGTINVMEGLRELKRPCAAVIVTTDKCYENREWLYAYREEDPLGGYDPYSSSKAAAELAVGAWRRSFFQSHPVRIASARAGNVIGGGDWAKDRIVPDCIRTLQAGEPVPVRNKAARRPWQHVLEPLSGYLWLGACLLRDQTRGPRGVRSGVLPPSALASAFNFGPTHESNRTVEELVAEVLKHWPGRWADKSDPKAVHEAKLLQLATDKAHALLGWSPVWDFATAIQQTVKWYKAVLSKPKTASAITSRQIHQYAADAARAGLPWAAE